MTIGLLALLNCMTPSLRWDLGLIGLAFGGAVSATPEPEEQDSPEKQGPIPWWLWIGVLVVLVFAFLIRGVFTA